MPWEGAAGGGGGCLGGYGKGAYFVQSESFLNRMQSWPTKSNPATEKVLSLQFYQPCHTFTPVEEISLFHGQIQVRPHIGSTCRTPQSYTPSIASGSLTQVFGLKTLIPSLLDCKPLSVSHERRCAGNLISWQVPLTAVHNLHPHPKKTPTKNIGS